jgi:hypothetical protein
MSTNDYFKNFNSFGEKWIEFANTVYQPAVELHKITTDAFERATKYQLDTANELLQTSTEKAKKLADIKKLEDLTKFCSTTTEEASSKALAYTKASMDNALQTSTELSQWFEKGLDQFKQQTKKATAAAK